MICTVDLCLGALPEADDVNSEKLEITLSEPLVNKWKELEPLNYATINKLHKMQTEEEIEFNVTYATAGWVENKKMIMGGNEFHYTGMMVNG